MTRARKVFLVGCFALATLLLVGTLWNYSAYVLTLSLALTSVATLGVIRNKTAFFVFLFAFFLGPLSEVLCIWFGVWSYTTPHILGIPMWLPFVWGNAGIVIFYSTEVFRRK